MNIVLASMSPRRQEILTHLGVNFTSIPSNIDECKYIYDTPYDEAMNRALVKAQDVARNLLDPTIVIGADTLVYSDRVIGKPQDGKDAFNILKELQGTTHKVITGLAVIRTTDWKKRVVYEETSVDMAPMSDDEIKKYIATGEPMDKAGAYGIQGRASVYIKGIRGCFYNVVGLPIHRLWNILKEFNIEI